MLRRFVVGSSCGIVRQRIARRILAARFDPVALFAAHLGQGFDDSVPLSFLHVLEDVRDRSGGGFFGVPRSATPLGLVRAFELFLVVKVWAVPLLVSLLAAVVADDVGVLVGPALVGQEFGLRPALGLFVCGPALREMFLAPTAGLGLALSSGVCALAASAAAAR